MQSLVDGLDLPADWTIEEFFAELERMRGRRIVRLPLPPTAPVGLCGLWLACKRYDVIFLRQSSDPAAELHVALHEVGHMLLDHGQDASISTVELTTLTSGVALDREIDLSTVRAARGISSYDSEEEYEAELLASLIGIRARTVGPRRDPMLKEI
ncbi:ImmA/IrrE family metallo-endopeptidase [Nocardia arthritidis]|uniref:ImmA/IrrE family metallo-endopeptidase n=1 Tax=Nocardia arthritidis TaxID=228602 RepID=A0A6G9YHG7_9NOCA|nr:ImmA/IrrE family metallo-endopeptidase [Nocardia arthritidis]QIS12393.1 ImmA/IrrE family metallo-endopeptidase [Nocardia arthritidis]